MAIEIRQAVESDIKTLAEVELRAYGGYAEVMYAGAVPGMTPKQILELRLEQPDTTYHFSNGWVAEEDGAALGGAHAYPIDDENDDPPDAFVPSERVFYFAPMEELSLPGSFYLNAIAVFDDHRGQGVADRLMELAVDAGERSGLGSMSLLVFAANRAACRLYERFGFAEAKRCNVVGHDALRFDGDLLLMSRRL